MMNGRFRAPTLTAARAWAVTHDLVVVGGALLVLLIAIIAHGIMAGPDLAELSTAGLTIAYPRGWLDDVAGKADALPVQHTYHPLDSPLVRLEVIIDKAAPGQGDVGFLLGTQRRATFGAIYYKESERASDDGWERCTFEYAYMATRDSAPIIEHAIELARVKGNRLFIVRLHAPSQDRLTDMADDLLPTLELK
ncbi:MAG TPA: hypothetical protein VFG83_07350 [Kofleriaceae bacterium]|nr:hypothetical protein [Kofleriaceae bacterium]